MNHVRSFTLFLAVFLLLAGITPCVSAFTISSTNVSPRGYQAAGTPMTINAVIDFPSKDFDTFPRDSELQLSTSLVHAYWDPVLVLDGVETHLGKEAGDSLTVTGYYLSYPASQNVQLKVTLTGTIPANPSPDQDLVKALEMDSAMHVVSTARVAMSEAPFMALTTDGTPTTRPTPTKKIFTPIPTTTTTQESPISAEAGILATVGAALVVARRKIRVAV